MQNSRIIQLDPLLANQIAAGEVIERPCSVVKELVENSIDAKATRIDIDIEGAGTHLIRIRDNGIGIAKADLSLAFCRHATSKIKTTDDLAKILTLGFRGEALASIASVARCRMISQSNEEKGAWEINIAADLSFYIQPAAHPMGTTIEVADLFYNTPARRKFLRSEKTEFQFIDEMVKRLALSHPKVSFRLKHQGRQLRYYPAISHLTSASNRLAKICGQQFIDAAMEIDIQNGDLQLHGWLGMTNSGHRQADCQYLFVNQRMVKDRIMNHAIKTIYQQQPDFVEGSYPCFVLYLTVDPREVDVNVHPTKQEVRFQHARFVHDFITKCVDNALTQAKKLDVQREKAVLPKEMPLQIASPVRSETLPAAFQAMSSNCDYKKRYFFIEDAKGVTIIDLSQAKGALLERYFATQLGNIPQKNLLFPQTIVGIPAVEDPKYVMQAFMRFGFTLRISKQQNPMLLQKPAIMNDKDEKIIVFLLAQIASGASDARICTLLGEALNYELLWQLPQVLLQSIIESWLKDAPNSGFIHLSHEHIRERAALLV